MQLKNNEFVKGTDVKAAYRVTVQTPENADMPIIWDVYSLANVLDITPKTLAYLLKKKGIDAVQIKSVLRKSGKLPKHLYELMMKESVYQYFATPKKTGGYRVLSIPNPVLRKLQSALRLLIFNKIPVSDIACAYIPEGIEWQQKIFEVAGKKDLVGVADISDFFGSITDDMIRRSLREYEPSFNDEVLWFISQICTDGGVCPQGALTSPVISNIVMRKFDDELSTAMAKYGWAVCRYSDDIVFGKNISEMDFDFCIDAEMDTPLHIVEDLLSRYGFKMNKKKSWCREKSHAKPIMGLIVQSKINSTKQMYQSLRACVHTLVVKHIIPEMYKGSEQKYYRALKGKIAYWNRLNPDRYAALNDKLSLLTLEDMSTIQFSYSTEYNTFWDKTERLDQRIHRAREENVRARAIAKINDPF
jgi:RNA-directed DNA polymerase